MSKIAVITDSVACLPAEVVQKYGIHVAPVHVLWGKGEELRDNVDIRTEDFYARLRKLRRNDKLPTTSSGITGEYVQIYEKLAGKVDGAVVVALSSALGASYNSAVQAKDVVPNLPVEVVDPHTVLPAQGFVAVAAARAAQRGAGLKEVADAARALAPRVRTFWTMETLEYMRKGGRISLSKAILASFLKVKPLMGVNAEGKIEPLARPRTMAKAIDYMFNLLRQQTTQTPLHAAVVHADAPQDAERLRERLIAEFKPVEVWTCMLTPVIGTHMGPGTLGFSFYNE